MGVLGRIAGLLVLGLAAAGCYSPSVRDCTVSCGSPDDCAAGQVCGHDGMCAAPEVAGRCAMLAPDAGSRDGGAPHGDGGPPRDGSVDARPDASTVRLTVQISGKGRVDVEGVGACSSLDPQKGNCAYDVMPGITLTALADQIQSDQVFTRWTSTTCSGEGPRCVFTLLAATTITARFDKTGIQIEL